MTSDPAELETCLGEFSYLSVEMIQTGKRILNRMDSILFSAPGNLPATGFFQSDCTFVISLLMNLADQEASSC